MDGLIEFNLGTTALGKLSFDKLLFLEMDDSTVFLACLDEFLALRSSILLLLLELLFISLELANLGLDINDSLIVFIDPILTCTSLNWCRLVALLRYFSRLRLHTIAHFSNV